MQFGDQTMNSHPLPPLQNLQKSPSLLKTLYLPLQMLFLEDGRVHNELLHAEPENFFLRVPWVPEVRLAAFGIGICHVVKIKSERKLACTSDRKCEVFWTCQTNQKKC